jgi:N-acetylglucosamine-1-phosphate transferase, gamma subunit
MCGNRTAIHNVTEPRTCEYLVELSTPLVCHPDSMLVYPTLSGDLQDEWDTLEGLRQQDIITPKVTFVTILVFL